jgi:hypothetical protein
VPINVTDPSAPGVTYIVTGGGGAPLYPSGSDTWTAYSESRHEYLRGTADACTLDIQAVGADSAVFDTVTLTQCAAPPDTENPAAAISSPASGANVSGIVEVDVAATDNVAVTGVDLLVDDTVVASDGEEPFQFFVDSRTLSNGGHSLKARAFDAAGNTATSATVAITVTNAAPDTQVPTASISSPADGSTVNDDTTVNVDASDNVAVTRVELWADGSLSSTDNTAPFGFTIGSLNLSTGTHTLQAKAYDAAGNTGSSSVIGVTVDRSTPPVSDIVLYAADAPIRVGNWVVVNDTTAAGGKRLRNPNASGAKIVTASANPANYFEMTFNANAGQRYHLWMRGKADSNNYANDSVFVQFDGTVDSGGNPVYRMGTTSAAEYNLEDCSGCGVANWGWQDNGYAGFGLDLFFGTTGPQTLRIQVREDGLSLDQIVLSPSTYLTTAPGPLKNDTTILPKSGGGSGPPPDTTAPTTSITAPANGAQVSGTVTVTANASDNVGVAHVDLYVDNAVVATTIGAPYTFNWNTAGLSGSHTLQTRAYDAANNVGTSATTTVTISSGGTGPADIVLYASEAPIRVGNWTVVADASAAGGSRLRNPNAGHAKIVTASASPADYVEISFQADADVPYHLWIRGKADSNNYANDSVFVQFSDAKGQNGALIYGIGTTSATEYNLEDCSGCGVSNWGWQDNGYAGMGLDITFANGGMHTMRIQTREDGLSIDQIVLSPSRFLTAAPGPLKNDSTILPKQ